MMGIKRILAFLFIPAIATALHASAQADSIPLSAVQDSVYAAAETTTDAQTADSVEFSHLPWYRQLLDNGFRIHDPRIDYPAFPRLLLNIYDWGDRTFNSYDPEYVVGSGKNWKIMGKSYNWMESYMLLFSMRSHDMLHIRSDIYDDIGAYLSFMAVSVGYTAKLKDWIGQPSNRSNFNFNFTCSRLAANIDILSTKGGAQITHFGDYKGPLLNYDFSAISHKALSGEFYYFFNHRKYSQAAAYYFSKYQLKNAGSAIIGFAFNNQRMWMDFSDLPDDLKKHLPSLESVYKFRYTDYCVLAGYAYNWAIRPRRWLANITAIPSLGYRHSYSDSSEGKKRMFATNLRFRFSIVYNHKAFFAALMGRMDANLYFNSQYTFFNATESISLIAGARF